MFSRSGPDIFVFASVGHLFCCASVLLCICFCFSKVSEILVIRGPSLAPSSSQGYQLSSSSSSSFFFAFSSSFFFAFV